MPIKKFLGVNILANYYNSLSNSLLESILDHQEAVYSNLDISDTLDYSIFRPRTIFKRLGKCIICYDTNQMTHTCPSNMCVQCHSMQTPCQSCVGLAQQRIFVESNCLMCIALGYISSNWPSLFSCTFCNLLGHRWDDCFPNNKLLMRNFQIPKQRVQLIRKSF